MTEHPYTSYVRQVFNNQILINGARLKKKFNNLFIPESFEYSDDMPLKAYRNRIDINNGEAWIPKTEAEIHLLIRHNNRRYYYEYYEFQAITLEDILKDFPDYVVEATSEPLDTVFYNADQNLEQIALDIRERHVLVKFTNGIYFIVIQYVNENGDYQDSYSWYINNITEMRKEW